MIPNQNMSNSKIQMGEKLAPHRMIRITQLSNSTLKLNSQTQLSNSTLKLNSQTQLSNSTLKLNSQTQLSNSTLKLNSQTLRANLRLAEDYSTGGGKIRGEL